MFLFLFSDFYKAKYSRKGGSQKKLAVNGSATNGKAHNGSTMNGHVKHIHQNGKNDGACMVGYLFCFLNNRKFFEEIE